MKKTMHALLTVLMALSLAACTAGGTPDAEGDKQTASAYLNQAEDATLAVTVDLSDGWSVEFARSAAYLYDGEIVEDNGAVATLISLDKEVYEECLEMAMADESHKEADDGIYFTLSEDEEAYLASVEDSAFVLITTTDEDDIEPIVGRVTLSRLSVSGEAPPTQGKTTLTHEYATRG